MDSLKFNQWKEDIAFREIEKLATMPRCLVYYMDYDFIPPPDDLTPYRATLKNISLSFRKNFRRTFKYDQGYYLTEESKTAIRNSEDYLKIIDYYFLKNRV